MSYKYDTFEDWHEELEGFSLRAERIPKEAVSWVKAAFESAREKNPPFEGFVALPVIDNADWEMKPGGGIIKSDKKALSWGIVKKEVWNQHGYLDESGEGLDIPDFDEDMESVYSYQPDWPCDNLEKQSKLLTDLGFEVLELGLISLS